MDYKDMKFRMWNGCDRGLCCKAVGRQDRQLNTYDWLADVPGNAESTDLVEVQFKNTRKAYYHNVNNLDLKKGDVLSMDNVRIIRPGYGEKPKYLDDILGMKIDRDVEWGTPFSFDMLCKGSILLLTGNKDRAELCEKLKVSHPDKEIYCISNKITLDLIQNKWQLTKEKSS